MSSLLEDVVAVQPPRLENGDRLTRHEFERRYAAMPGIKKAELIEGVVHMPSPVSARHAIAHQRINLWLGTYQMHTPCIEIAANATLRLDLENELQPDAVLFIEQACGGRVRVSTDGYLEGAPELIAEIAFTSASIDLHAKFKVYRRSGVREYLVWQTETRRIDWWALREDDYFLIAANEHGIIASRVFPGLRLDVPAMLADDMRRVMQALQAGLASAEHAAFVTRLAADR